MQKASFAASLPPPRISSAFRLIPHSHISVILFSFFFATLAVLTKVWLQSEFYRVVAHPVMNPSSSCQSVQRDFSRAQREESKWTDRMSDWIQFYSLRGRRLTVSLPGLTKGILSKKLTSPRAQWQHWQRKWDAGISVPPFAFLALSKNAVALLISEIISCRVPASFVLPCNLTCSLLINANNSERYCFLHRCKSSAHNQLVAFWRRFHWRESFR